MHIALEMMTYKREDRALALTQKTVFIGDFPTLVPFLTFPFAPNAISPAGKSSQLVADCGGVENFIWYFLREIQDKQTNGYHYFLSL